MGFEEGGRICTGWGRGKEMGGGDRKRQMRAQGALERTLLGQEWPASGALMAVLKGQARRGNVAGTSARTLYLVLPVVWDK